jgi:uncharacterized membrane protein
MDITRSSSQNINVSPVERGISVAAGLALFLYGMTRRGWKRGVSFFLGGNLLNRGATGHCPVYQAIGVKPVGEQAREHKSGIKVSEHVIIYKSPQELYSIWRNLENLPRIMRHVESVEVIDDKRSRWKVRGPAGVSISWEAEIVQDIPPELITWQTLEGADIIHAGSVSFQPVLEGAGTEVKVTLRYDPPGGVATSAIAGLLGQEPSQQIKQDLRDFRRQVESGHLSSAGLTNPEPAAQPS